jgi:hypothetical protein
VNPLLEIYISGPCYLSFDGGLLGYRESHLKFCHSSNPSDDKLTKQLFFEVLTERLGQYAQFILKAKRGREF